MEQTGLGDALVLDASGVVQAPNLPYTVIDSAMRLIRPSHPSMQAVLASIKENAPQPHGLPPGAPDPNEIFLKDGKYVRYVIDSTEPREKFVAVLPDGRSEVRERLRFTSRLVCPSLEAARKAVAAGQKADFWNGYTWIRDGYKPERDFPVMAAQAARMVDGDEIVFEQAVSSTEEAAIRHSVLLVEAMGADPRLTDAVCLLGAARERVADFIDGVPGIQTVPHQTTAPGGSGASASAAGHAACRSR
mgnify:CR=1 FL=1